MASNASKAWNTIKGVTSNYVNWAAKHPVKSSLLNVLTFPVTGATGSILNTAAQFVDPDKKSSAKKKVTDTKTSYNYTPVSAPTTDTTSTYSGSGGSGGYGGSGGGSVSVSPLASGIVKPDISGLLAAYDQQAESAKKTAQNTYDTTRNDLLTSLKRFQEQNAKDVENQRQNYLSTQSSLDVAREQANRQNRIAASSRGLGGSGLQQLAQLQTLMAQGEDISNAASSNQKALDALRLALQQREDDYNTNLAKAQTTLDTALNNIDSNLAQQKAKAIFDVEQDYANTLNSLLMSGGSGGGSGRGGSGSGSSDTGFDAYLENVLDDLNAELQGYSGLTSKQLNDAINSRYGTGSSYKNTYGNVSNIDQARNVLGRVALNRIGDQVYDGMSSAAYNNAKARAQSMVNSLQNATTKKSTTKTATKKSTAKTTKKKK